MTFRPNIRTLLPFFLVPAALVALLVGGLFIIGTLLEPAEQALASDLLWSRRLEVLSLSLLLAAVLGLSLRWLLVRYILPLSHLASNVRTILSAPPDYRIDVTGSPDVERVVKALNRTVEKTHALREEVEERVEEGRRKVEYEKNTLAALMQGLPEGVLLCTKEGMITLYNQRAKDLLTGADQAYIGLGRSIFGLISKEVVGHGLDELAYRQQQGRQESSYHFVSTTPDGRLVRAALMPIDEEDLAGGGFLLLLHDVPQQVDRNARGVEILRRLDERIRAAVGSIRAAAETLIAFPSMDAGQKERFHEVIHEEAVGLSSWIDETFADHAGPFDPHWSLEPMLVIDLIAALERRMTVMTEVRFMMVNDGGAEAGRRMWLRADGYALVQGMLFLIERLRDANGAEDFVCRVGQSGRIVSFTLSWPGRTVPVETLRQWMAEPIATGGVSVSLGEIVRCHDGELWPGGGSENGSPQAHAELHMLLPASADEPAIRSTTPIRFKSRPEFYDLDLFVESSISAELEQLSLASLAYTVFDTETTGLDPSGGDEIIQLGAVRMVNGRVLRSEVLDHLISPKRAISPDSYAIHGISDDMLRGKPPIEDVLPSFYRFAKGTVLVGHNAAFDMRFLALNEGASGIRFDQPVLDTLLLSAVVFPDHIEHSLDAVAGRLGVSILGRHTALGDALVTAEVFLKIVPILAEMGITTLAEARDASRKTMMGRLKY
jgi:DNA polymerase III subunit epsilon